MFKVSLKKIAYVVIIAAIVCVLLFFISKNTLIKHTDTNQSDYSLKKQIHYSFTLQNKSNRVIEKAEFWTYGPVKQTSTQYCNHITASHPYELIEDKWGNQILYFTFENLPPYASKVITITAEIMHSQEPHSMELPRTHPFLESEKYIESDNIKLASFAQTLKETKPLKTAENIFQWVAKNLKYTGYISDDRGALYAFTNKKGDCTESMYLFAALCRANKIPARGIGGYVYSKNAILRPDDYHNWAEFYIDHTWNIADPQKRVFMKNQSHYIAMRIIADSPENPLEDFHRFRYKGEGLKVSMN